MKKKSVIKTIIHKYLYWLYSPLTKVYHNKKLENNANKLIDKFCDDISKADRNKRWIFYLGITNHSNLGDMAQHFCITKWLEHNYSDSILLKVESDAVVYNKERFLKYLKQNYKVNDFIVFQSGYTTQDLGGNHELMHRIIIQNMPNANILMMPQTIFFKEEKNKLRTAKIYNTANNMLFLARDMVSFDMAKKMFPDINVQAFPDIVTSLIGKTDYHNERNGICLCTRDDGEKYYSEEEINKLKNKLSQCCSVKQTDTTISNNYLEIRNNMSKFIFGEIEKFSHFDVTVTDRYHGTIFSLAAGTPVIIIKTTDHKVTTGADWFKGIFDDYVYVAKDLDEVILIYNQIMNKHLTHKLEPYFEKNYYSKLKLMFETIIQRNEHIN